MPLCSRPCAYCAKVMKEVTPGTRYCSLECYFDFHAVKHPEGCWEWKGVHSTLGYGKMMRGRGNLIHAHRFSYERANGPLPQGKLVLHQCDNPGCTRPEHLFAGTHAENTADMIKKGRHGKGYSTGAKNPAAKLTEADILKIRAHPSKGILKLAKEYGVHRSAILKIRSRQTWSHIA